MFIHIARHSGPLVRLDQLERTPIHFNFLVRVLGRQRSDGALEVTLTDETPGSDDVRDDVDDERETRGHLE